MGLEKFTPEKRSITITDESDTVSSTVSVAQADGQSSEDLKIEAKSAVLIDGASGDVLYESEPYKHLPPASVTKVMTLLLILEGVDSEKIKLNDKVVISERAAGMGGSQMYMEPGEKHTVEELLKGVIMVSANDGCVAHKNQAVWEHNQYEIK
ncbi:MAG: D-alanyl-D-alanine carboxypeptidase [Clostridiales bacterium]|nr:D-alanyl-D-alanine carboxypeptidase [Clostridiales bacterium]